MSARDFTVLAIYVALLLILGPLFRRFSRNANEYFRGGGNMLWWMVGAGALMGNLSAWAFTGIAGKIYATGSLVYLYFVGDALGFVLAYFLFAAWFRRMRVITAVEAIRLRFGPAAEQFYLWVPLPVALLTAALRLYATSLFVGTLFGLPINVTIWSLGGVMTILVVLGGSWAVVASDFLQMLLLMSISLIVSVLVLRDPAVGGISGLVAKVPSASWHWTELSRPSVLIPWIVFVAFSEILSIINLSTGAPSFLMVRDEREARRASLLPLFILLIFPIVWGIPPMAASFIYHQMPAYAQGLEHPEEAAYLVMAKRVLPDGILGLLVAGLFAATLSSLNTGLNRAAGIVVRSFYVPVLRPKSTAHQQVAVGRWLTLLFGVVIVGLSVALGSARSLPLFELGLLIGTSLGLPIVIPLTLVFFFRRAPGWASWSCTLVGLVFSLALNGLFTQARAARFWPGAPLSTREWQDLYLLVQVAGTTTICACWFIFSQRWGGRESVAIQEGRREFYARLERPLEVVAEDRRESEHVQYVYIGWLCALWGATVAAMAIMPNSPTGHGCFVIVGSAFGVVAVALLLMGRHAARAALQSPGQPIDVAAK